MAGRLTPFFPSRRQFLGLVAASTLVPFRGRLTAAAAAPLFEEIPPSVSGITWTHENAMSPDRYLPETMGPGVAIADYDNDGYPDIFVTAYGRCTLYRNNGNGTFTDVTAKAGLAAPGWTTSAVWFDYDNDGKLDLFLCSFVEFSLKNNVFCGDNKLGKRFYCIPRVFKPTPSLLFHNNGDGTFTKASVDTSIQKALGKGLGVVATDLNGDGLLDLFVANDTVQNFLFMNRGKGKWDEIGLMSEVAFSANGTPRSGMGVDAADVNNDGKQLVNVSAQAGPVFTETFAARGLAIGDYDNDGRIDVLVGNNGGAPLLLKNRAGDGHHWLGVTLQGTGCNRDAIGARITWAYGDVVRTRFKSSGGSYLSAHDPREVLGTGTASKIAW